MGKDRHGRVTGKVDQTSNDSRSALKRTYAYLPESMRRVTDRITWRGVSPDGDGPEISPPDR